MSLRTAEAAVSRAADIAADCEWQRQCDEHDARQQAIQEIVDDVLSGEQVGEVLETHCDQTLAQAIATAAQNDWRLYNALADAANRYAREVL